MIHQPTEIASIGTNLTDCDYPVEFICDNVVWWRSNVRPIRLLVHRDSDTLTLHKSGTSLQTPVRVVVSSEGRRKQYEIRANQRRTLSANDQPNDISCARAPQGIIRELATAIKMGKVNHRNAMAEGKCHNEARTTSVCRVGRVPRSSVRPERLAKRYVQLERGDDGGGDKRCLAPWNGYSCETRPRKGFPFEHKSDHWRACETRMIGIHISQLLYSGG